MKQVLTVSCKLQVPKESLAELDATLQAFADACNYIHAFIEPKFSSPIRMQMMCYQEVRANFKLSANLAIQAIRRVSAARKAAKGKGSTVVGFQPTSVNYDQRIFSFREEAERVGLTLLHGKQWFQLAIGNYQRGLLKGQQPTSATLSKRRDGSYYIQIQLKSTPPATTKPDKIIGIDLGRRDIAHTSEGQAFSGDEIDRVRDQFGKVRASAQHKASKGTRSQRRRCRELLQRLSGRERRFQAQVNHTVSKRLVERAVSIGACLALEDLTGIRERTNTLPRNSTERRRSNTWAFFQLRQFLSYKALRAGIALLLVLPQYTSQTCHRCLHIGKRGGKSFNCANCGYHGDADLNGAKNIALLGAVVNQPDGPGLFCPVSFGQPRALESSLHTA